MAIFLSVLGSRFSVLGRDGMPSLQVTLAGVEVAYNFGRLKAITTGGIGAGRIGLIEPATDIGFMGQDNHLARQEASVTLIVQ